MPTKATKDSKDTSEQILEAALELFRERVRSVGRDRAHFMR